MVQGVILHLLHQSDQDIMKCIRLILLAGSFFLTGSSVYAGTVQKNVTTHVIDKGQTLSGIARMYGTTAEELKKLNPGLDIEKIKAGEKLIVPSKGNSTQSSISPKQGSSNTPVAVSKTVPSNNSVTRHTVEKGETGYAICKKYGITLSDLMKLNNMTAPDIKAGQVLIVSGNVSSAATAAKTLPVVKDPSVKSTAVTSPSEDKPVVKNEVKTTIVSEDPTDPTLSEFSKPASNKAGSQSQVSASAAYNLSETSSLPLQDQFQAYNSMAALERKSVKGVASYLSDANESAGNVALYNGCPIGTVLKVRNLMNNKVVYLKVVGKLPESEVSKDITVKISGAAAKNLGALDEKFLAEVTSYIPK